MKRAYHNVVHDAFLIVRHYWAPETAVETLQPNVVLFNRSASVIESGFGQTHDGIHPGNHLVRASVVVHNVPLYFWMGLAGMADENDGCWMAGGSYVNEDIAGVG